MTMAHDLSQLRRTLLRLQDWVLRALPARLAALPRPEWARPPTPERRAWRHTRSLGTREAFLGFLRAYPRSPRAGDAFEAIVRIDEARRGP